LALKISKPCGRTAVNFKEDFFGNSSVLHKKSDGLVAVCFEGTSYHHHLTLMLPDAKANQNSSSVSRLVVILL
jgi:hypothetical protein